MVREVVLEGDVMAKRAGILVKQRVFASFLDIVCYFKAYVIGENNKAFVQRSQISLSAI
jgi:hypothetical protein